MRTEIILTVEALKWFLIQKTLCSFTKHDKITFFACYLSFIISLRYFYEHAFYHELIVFLNCHISEMLFYKLKFNRMSIKRANYHILTNLCISDQKSNVINQTTFAKFMTTSQNKRLLFMSLIITDFTSEQIQLVLSFLYSFYLFFSYVSDKKVFTCLLIANLALESSTFIQFKIWT